MSRAARLAGLRRLPIAALLLVVTVAATAPSARSAPSEVKPPAAEPTYLDPVDLAVTPDGKTLAVACSGTDSLLLVDLPGGPVRREVAVGHRPWAVTLDRAGTTAYVALRDDDAVAVVDLASGTVTRRLAVGPGPLDVALDRDETHLFTANNVSGDVSVVDLGRGVETKRLRAGVRPRALALSPDGSILAVANLLNDLHQPDRPPSSQVTLIDAARERVIERVALPGANVLQAIATLPEGGFLVPLVRPKNLVPLVQVAGGWTMTNGLARIVPADPPAAEGAGGPPPGTTRVDQILVDSRGRHYADPSSVAIAPDGRTAYVSAAGADRLLVVDLEAMGRAMGSSVAGADPHPDPYLADRLDLAGRFVRAALPTGPVPVAVAVAPDGRRAYVADRLGDTVTVIDTSPGGGADRVAGEISLGGGSRRRAPSSRRCAGASGCSTTRRPPSPASSPVPPATRTRPTTAWSTTSRPTAWGATWWTPRRCAGCAARRPSSGTATTRTSTPSAGHGRPSSSTARRASRRRSSTTWSPMSRRPRWSRTGTARPTAA